MKERPILFSAPMVRAILEGRKTQTRRIVKWKPREPGLNLAFSGLELARYHSSLPESGWVLQSRDGNGCWNDRTHPLQCPYSDGVRLWVREAHAQFAVGEGLEAPVPQCVAYRATCDSEGGFDYINGRGEVSRLKVTKWTPAIFMPRWASRITLEVTGVRIERAQDISREDAIAEGAKRFDDIPPSKLFPSGEQSRWSMEQPEDCGQCLGSPQTAFGNLWIKINGQESWDANPWVWVIEFKRIEAQERAA